MYIQYGLMRCDLDTHTLLGMCDVYIVFGVYPTVIPEDGDYVASDALRSTRATSQVRGDRAGGHKRDEGERG